MITIRDVKTILTAPDGANLVVVKIQTSEPGLYGLGCATFTQRHLTVYSAIEDYLKPFLIGKDVHRIEDIWQSAMVSAYWRNGPIMNNAISGVDMALWDIKGKLAGMPLYQLLGGKVREAAHVYVHADGRDKEEVAENVSAFMERGFRYVRAQLGDYGGEKHQVIKPENALEGSYFDPKAYMRKTIELFEHLRSTLGFEVELLHDIHERLTPIDAITFAKELEKFKLFFLEDALPPEQVDWFKMMRQHTSIPIAVGELFNNPNEWMNLIKDRLIDFIRIHTSQIGGITPSKKIVSTCEAFGIRTAWHGPKDVSPVGHAANLHLDISSHNFGVQEFSFFNEATQELFPGCPEVRNGYLYPNDKPGLGIDINEQLAAKYECNNSLPEWMMARLPDGTAVRP
ncbi:enolase C-terminal domain-like protein [Bacillus sp. JJ1566]|uniref:enolase C-terminal domain-like protein n=1 Tax=Bacillus sp. JJ1566 TaxID=3122961 RepID=UPI002FFE05BD